MAWEETAVRVAELVCQKCGATTYSSPLANVAGLAHGAATMARCECGGRSQVIRVVKRRPARLEDTQMAQRNAQAANRTASAA